MRKRNAVPAALAALILLFLLLQGELLHHGHVMRRNVLTSLDSSKHLNGPMMDTATLKNNSFKYQPSPNFQHGQNTKEHTTAHSDLLARATINNETKLLATDLIYSREWWEKPTVIEEYKLIFFSIPKVGSTEWKLFFRIMMGMEPPGNDENMLKYQDPATNNLTHLGDYSLADAEGMMKSPEWTKAVFVREPKERVLSAFLNKAAKAQYFARKCCIGLKDDAYDTCILKGHAGHFAYFLKRTMDCHDPHWLPQVTVIDEKWWPYINFIGYMNNIADDTKRLLKSLTSVHDGVSAWAKHGQRNIRRDDGIVGGFMQSNVSPHATDARAKLLETYTAENEAFVEKNWAVEWDNSFFHFEPVKLYGLNGSAY